MTRMEELVRLMKELEEQLVVCMRCGMCQAVCPLYAETGKEADVARGKLALLDGLMKSMFDDPEGVGLRLNKCLLCGSCAANCPSGVKVLDIFMKARVVITGYVGLPPAKRLVLRGMLAHPGLFDKVLEWGEKFQSLLTRPVNDVVGTSCARFTSPLLSDRHFKTLSPTPLHRSVPVLDTPAGASGIRAAFFTGCLIDKLFPQVAESVIQVLNHHGIGIFMPQGQGCCGIPAVSSGDTATFSKLVRYNLELFESGRWDYLITACATCTSTLKKVWPALLENENTDIRTRVKALSDKTLDISQLLVSVLNVPLAPVQESGVGVTYHDPCHLKKSLGVAAQPRTLIRAAVGHHFTEMPEPDACCGMGGSFNLQYYEISAKIGRKKRDQILSTKADVVATGCPACMMQISDMLSRSGDRIQVKHFIEIYAASLRQTGTV
jgi:glycolate oxidase iron-sulfur subunit